MTFDPTIWGRYAGGARSIKRALYVILASYPAKVSVFSHCCTLAWMEACFMVSRGKYPSVKVVAFELKQWHIIYDSFDLQMAASLWLPRSRTWDLSMVGRIVWRCEVSKCLGIQAVVCV